MRKKHSIRLLLEISIFHLETSSNATSFIPNEKGWSRFWTVPFDYNNNMDGLDCHHIIRKFLNFQNTSCPWFDSKLQILFLSSSPIILKRDDNRIVGLAYVLVNKTNLPWIPKYHSLYTHWFGHFSFMLHHHHSLRIVVHLSAKKRIDDSVWKSINPLEYILKLDLKTSRWTSFWTILQDGILFSW